MTKTVSDDDDENIRWNINDCATSFGILGAELDESWFSW